MTNRFLCNTTDIPPDACKGFSLNEVPDKKSQDIFIVNRNNQFYAYKNSCPHTGASLNWQPDIFMDYDNFYIQCSIHAARFEVETGICVWGPCVNQSLKKTELTVIDNKIFLTDQAQENRK